MQSVSWPYFRTVFPILAIRQNVNPLLVDDPIRMIQAIVLRSELQMRRNKKKL